MYFFINIVPSVAKSIPCLAKELIELKKLLEHKKSATFLWQSVAFEIHMFQVCYICCAKAYKHSFGKFLFSFS